VQPKPLPQCGSLRLSRDPGLAGPLAGAAAASRALLPGLSLRHAAAVLPASACGPAGAAAASRHRPGVPGRAVSGCGTLRPAGNGGGPNPPPRTPPPTPDLPLPGSEFRVRASTELELEVTHWQLNSKTLPGLIGPALQTRIITCSRLNHPSLKTQLLH
jgi:hypothetical protein